MKATTKAKDFNNKHNLSAHKMTCQAAEISMPTHAHAPLSSVATLAHSLADGKELCTPRIRPAFYALASKVIE